MTKYYNADLVNKIVAARNRNAKICQIEGQEIVWQSIDRAETFVLTGNLYDVDGDMYLLLAETYTRGVYIPIIDGTSDWVFSTPHIIKQNKKSIFPIIAIATIFIALSKK